ncbi:flagellin [Candidatus Nitrosotalea bavarica]|uniref:flagellin n=1 Tax=Candidatus Nitrosotalea bavarica TaxID=1903277 RepID=UPI000C708BBC|nr:flagellin [Candidatus Nitrosotalea bavarica]
MGSAVITEAILLIASVIIAGALAGVVMTKVGTFQSTFTQTTENQKQTVLTNIKILYAQNSTSSSVTAWVKNVGTYSITNTQNIDVYFGQTGSMQRISYNAAGSPSWAFPSQVTSWDKANTVQINITDLSIIKCGSVYELQVTTPNGVSDEYFVTFC